MATIEYTPYEVDRRGDHCHIIRWENMGIGDDGLKLEMPGSADRTVQVFGTFGTGGNLTIEGSNDGTHWATLSDTEGNALNFTSAGLKAIVEVTRYIRPRVTAVSGSVALNVFMLVRRPAR